MIEGPAGGRSPREPRLKHPLGKGFDGKSEPRSFISQACRRR